MKNVGSDLKLPSNLYLETTNRCNLRCKGCIHHRGSWEPQRDLTLKEIIMICDLSSGGWRCTGLENRC
jgi:MoaA/NifB/PqqE/SkfB family radical SAM enzyme